MAEGSHISLGSAVWLHPVFSAVEKDRQSWGEVRAVAVWVMLRPDSLRE